MKYKKTLRYTQGFKKVEKELTWDMFYKYLNENMEFWFYHGKEVIDISYHFKNEKKIYELNISNGENSKYFTFDTVDELVNFKVFDNKSLYEIWDDLEN